MGLRYLNGLTWDQVTRDERFFCQRLFSRILQNGIPHFLDYLNRKHQATLDPAANWELAYEACFYRDLWHLRGSTGVLYSPKRTFDLCLFSDMTIVVIEAKADQSFDDAQLRSFQRDKDQIKAETGVSRVLLAGLVSSRYTPSPVVRAFFDGPFLTWREITALYANDPILARADALYTPSATWNTGRNNTHGKLSGAQLMLAHQRGEVFFVGRENGLTGRALAKDVESDTWRTQKYETNRNTTEPPNTNWFLLSDFARRIEGGR